MAKETPDLHKVFDRLFSKSREKPTIAGQALFQRPTGARPKAAQPASASIVAPAGRWKRPARSGPGLVTGLDLGASAAKLVRVERANGAARVSAVVCQEFPAGMAEAERGPFVRSWLKNLRRQGLLAGTVVMGLAEDKIAVEQVTMPRMPASDLEKAVEWEAKEKMAVDPATHSIRYLKGSEVSLEGKPQLEILIFAVPREEILPPYHLISEHGGKVTAAEPGILSAADTLDAGGLFQPNEFVGVMDIGLRHTSLAFIIDRKVRFVRSFPVAGDAITRSIADYCKVEYALAEAQKREIGLPQTGALQPGGAGPEQDLRVRVGHALTLYLEKLASEVDHSLRYVTYYTLQRGSGHRLDRLYLIGGGSQLKNLPAFLESRVGAQVLTADPFERVLLSDEVAKQLPPGVLRARLASALGLALRPEGS